MDKTDRIYQPKTGTYRQHVLAALLGMPVAFVDENPNAVQRYDVTQAYRGLETKDLALGICHFAGVNPDAQPDDLLEGAWVNDEGLACMEAHTPDSFAHFIFTLYGLGGFDNRHWTTVRLPEGIAERHWC